MLTLFAPSLWDDTDYIHADLVFSEPFACIRDEVIHFRCVVSLLKRVGLQIGLDYADTAQTTFLLFMFEPNLRDVFAISHFDSLARL